MICSACERDKQPGDMVRRRKRITVDGVRVAGPEWVLTTICKKCSRDRGREWKADPDNQRRMRTTGAARRAVTKPQRKAAAAAWRVANRDHVREYERQKFNDGTLGAEARRETRRRYKRDNPDVARFSNARRAMQKRGVWVEDVVALVVLERDDGVCGICGGDVDPREFHVDHIVPLAAGGLHSYANVQAAHPSCNCRKQDRELDWPAARVAA